jgi:hypothetical protein
MPRAVESSGNAPGSLAGHGHQTSAEIPFPRIPADGQNFLNLTYVKESVKGYT